jgi:hypothetical protein
MRFHQATNGNVSINALTSSYNDLGGLYRNIEKNIAWLRQNPVASTEAAVRKQTATRDRTAQIGNCFE